MAVTANSLSAGITFTLTKSLTGFDTVTKQFSISGAADLDVSTYTDVYAATLSIASGANTDIDLYAALADLLGTTIAALKTKLAAMVVKVTGGTSCALVISPGASNGISGFLGGTTPTLTIPAPGSSTGVMVFKWPTHLTISNTTKVINFAASGGSGTLTVNVAFVLG